MSICLCYHDEQNFLHERGVCYGTKEKEPCSCGGNPVMCDFYEEVREKYIHRTNADRIRSMSDEELADFILSITWGESWITIQNGPSDCYVIGPNTNSVIEWLRTPTT